MIYCLQSISVTFDRDKLLETGQVIEMISIFVTFRERLLNSKSALVIKSGYTF